jgi:DHA2 family multidrug resistance protein
MTRTAGHSHEAYSTKLELRIVMLCSMAGTLMQALDSTIANVALPYMQGSLAASRDQITWVLTCYIIAAAIMTAPSFWPQEFRNRQSRRLYRRLDALRCGADSG